MPERIHQPHLSVSSHAHQARAINNQLLTLPDLLQSQTELRASGDAILFGLHHLEGFSHVSEFEAMRRERSWVDPACLQQA